MFGGGAIATYQTDIASLAQQHLDGSRRYNIEIGHLAHNLKGGIIMNYLFIIIALRAVFLGFKKSRNDFTRILAYVILGWLLLMFQAARPVGDPRFVLVCLAIGGCCSKEMRSMTTKQFLRGLRVR